MDHEERTLGNDFRPADILGWAVMLVRAPRTLFGRLATTGPLWPFAAYAFAWFAITSVVSFALTFFRPLPPLLQNEAIRIVLMAVGPLISLAFGLVAAAFLFVIWHLMGSPHKYGTAFRCWALLAPLSLAVKIAALIPFLPELVFAYVFFLLIIASQETHRTSAARAWTVWSLLFVLMLVLQVIALGVARIHRLQSPASLLPRGPRGETPQVPTLTQPGQRMLPPELKEQVTADLEKRRQAYQKEVDEEMRKRKGK